MKKNLPGPDPQEQLKAENDFLKMKLMLENGAQFSGDHSEDVPIEIENLFLKNIVEFESQFAEHTTIKVFERIGKPVHFKPVAAIHDHEIEFAWTELSSYLQENGIFLDVINPNITARELYRFTVEELFEYEMEDIRIPGMMHGFIYDEFYPDPVYDNEQRALFECMHQVFSFEKLQCDHLPHFKRTHLRLNEHYSLNIDEFILKINRFKSVYDELEMLELNESGCTRTETAMVFNGNFLVHALTGNDRFPLSGSWQVDFELNASTNEWVIHRVQIEGIRL